MEFGGGGAFDYANNCKAKWSLYIYTASSCDWLTETSNKVTLAPFDVLCTLQVLLCRWELLFNVACTLLTVRRHKESHGSGLCTHSGMSTIWRRHPSSKKHIRSVTIVVSTCQAQAAAFLTLLTLADGNRRISIRDLNVTSDVSMWCRCQKSAPQTLLLAL